jgi:23S rRNA (uracil1939-C5)-methyltransferase
MKLRIEKAVYGGAGLARIAEGDLAGKAAFAPLTLPGELVEAHLAEDKRGFLNLEADAILEPSPFRVAPGCPYFGACGGCSYQHAVYAHQVEIKAAILRETLERARLSTLPELQLASGPPWGYRNRVRLHFQANPFALGYRERRSSRLLAVDRCPIAAPLLEKAIVAVANAGERLGLAEFCDEIEFFSADDDSLLLSFVAARSAAKPRLPAIAQALQRELPQLRGAGLFAARGKGPSHLAQSWGDASLDYNAAGFGYRVGLGSFFQVNRFLVDALVDLVAADRRGRLAWDLYAGVGLFARALAKGFERVIAVEASPASAADLRHNLQGTSHRVVEAATLDFLLKQRPASSRSLTPSQTRSWTPPDLVVVDPPRAGLGSGTVAALAAIGPAEIVYVSCDPSTLARDLAALVQSGYDLRTITMVDLFPQTFHLESVSVLARR